MTDADLLPYIGKNVDITLVCGETLRGRFCSVEAQAMNIGRYAVAYRTGTDPVLHPEMYTGIHYAKQIQNIREIE